MQRTGALLRVLVPIIIFIQHVLSRGMPLSLAWLVLTNKFNPCFDNRLGY